MALDSERFETEVIREYNEEEDTGTMRKDMHS